MIISVIIIWQNCTEATLIIIIMMMMMMMIISVSVQITVPMFIFENLVYMVNC